MRRVRGDHPVSDARSRGAIEAPHVAVPLDNVTKNGTILIVDDERDIRFLMRFVLEKQGYRVVEAVHGASALDLIRNEQPALVITDLMMPVMDGGELVGSLRDASDTADIKAVLLTACPEKAPEGQFDRVMRKPFLPSELIAVVDELLRGEAS
ncbi:MAG: two-component system, OmpR family, alkaline phosphatase synthesis response regulator PhoP [Actinomycetota bacterium]|jgi:CheY-like chemotaxis protein